jgi:lipid-binding SYLF domain-containing protein
MRKVFSLIGAALILCAAAAPSAFADTKTDERLVDARQVFETFIDIKEQAIPTWLLQRAYGIVVVPRVIKGRADHRRPRRQGSLCRSATRTAPWTEPGFHHAGRRQHRLSVGRAVDGRQ